MKNRILLEEQFGPGREPIPQFIGFSIKMLKDPDRIEIRRNKSTTTQIEWHLLTSSFAGKNIDHCSDKNAKAKLIAFVNAFLLSEGIMIDCSKYIVLVGSTASYFHDTCFLVGPQDSFTEEEKDKYYFYPERFVAFNTLS